MDNAIHFFDELKKGMQQVEQAIEDWDYQDFSPDKRRALLEEQVMNDVADDREPEADAIQHIHSQQLNWSGLSPEDELDDYDCTAEEIPGSLSYESKVVLMSTPAGGIQGVPDADTLYRFLNKAQHAMEPQALTQALVSRLQDPNCCWQTRSKVLVLIHALIESVALAPHYLSLFKQNGGQLMLPLLEKLRTSDHNHVVRENARRALSLIQSNGANSMQIPRETTAVKANGATLASVRSKKANPSVNRRVIKSPPSAPLTSIKIDHQQRHTKKDDRHLHTSPKIARAALASWRRRNSQSQEDDVTETNPNLLQFQSPPQMMKSGSGSGFGYMASTSGITTSNASRYQSGQLSAFTFIQ